MVEDVDGGVRSESTMMTVGAFGTEGTAVGMTGGVTVGAEGREGASSARFEDPSSGFLRFRLMGAAATSPDWAICFKRFLFSFIVLTPANRRRAKVKKDNKRTG